MFRIQRSRFIEISYGTFDIIELQTLFATVIITFNIIGRNTNSVVLAITLSVDLVVINHVTASISLERLDSA